MEKKFRTLSAYLPSRRPSIPPALPFALQNGYGTSAAGQGIVVGTTGRTCPATASGRVTDATAHQASGDALSVKLLQLGVRNLLIQNLTHTTQDVNRCDND